MTKKKIKEFIREKLGTDILWIKKALLLIYSKQTDSEQVKRETTDYNGVGFTGYDSRFLSSVASQVKLQVKYSVENYGLKENEAINRTVLSDKQCDALKKMMPKYWKQVMDSCNEEKLEELINRRVAA